VFYLENPIAMVKGIGHSKELHWLNNR